MKIDVIKLICYSENNAFLAFSTACRNVSVQMCGTAARLSCTPQLHHNAAACVPQLHHTGREGHAGKGQKQRGGGGLGRRRSGGEGRGWERRGEKGRRGKGEERGGVVYASLHYNAFVCKHIQTYKTCKCLMFRGKLMCSNC